jgi:hypothetical protein
MAAIAASDAAPDLDITILEKANTQTCTSFVQEVVLKSDEFDVDFFYLMFLPNYISAKILSFLSCDKLGKSSTFGPV